MLYQFLLARSRIARRAAIGWLRAPLDEAWYALAMLRLGKKLSPTSTVAVVVHVYYETAWDELAHRIENVGDSSADLFVSIPIRHLKLVKHIRADLPNAHIVVVPNRGRDVLPFLKIARFLTGRGYTVALKVHAKASSPTWFAKIMECLLPQDAERIESQIAKVSRKDTGLLGPSDTYFPLSVYVERERGRITALLANLQGTQVARQVMEHPSRFGFFAGTMFWVRLDSILDLLELNSFQFPFETYRKGGSMAHAVERMFTLLPQLRGRDNFEVDADGAIRPRPPACGSIPPWFLGLVGPAEALTLLEELGSGYGHGL